MISSPLGYKIPQPNWISDQLATPWLHNSEVEKGRQTSIHSCGLVGQASQASLLQPRHLQMVSQIKQNSASSADDHRLMIMGYFIAKTHPLPKKVLQVAPKKLSCLQCFVTFGKPQFCATFGEQLKLAPHG